MNDTTQAQSLTLRSPGDFVAPYQAGNTDDQTLGALAKPVEEPAPETHAYVIDMSATNPGETRDHQIMWNGIAKTFSFTAGKPTKLPRAVAIKFLRHSDSFRLSNEEGDELLWNATPTQPEDLEAGQRLDLSEDETIARYDEMHTDALRIRVMQLPDGEKYAESSDRDEMVKFIVSARSKAAKLNSENDRAPDEFLPEADI